MTGYEKTIERLTKLRDKFHEYAGNVEWQVNNNQGNFFSNCALVNAYHHMAGQLDVQIEFVRLEIDREAALSKAEAQQ